MLLKIMKEKKEDKKGDKNKMEKIIITAGPEAAYLDAETRTRLWELAKKLGVSRNAITAQAIREYLARVEHDLAEGLKETA